MHMFLCVVCDLHQFVTTKLHTLATIRPTTTKASNRYEYAGNTGQTILKKHANRYTAHTAEHTLSICQPCYKTQNVT